MSFALAQYAQFPDRVSSTGGLCLWPVVSIFYHYFMQPLVIDCTLLLRHVYKSWPTLTDDLQTSSSTKFNLEPNVSECSFVLVIFKRRRQAL